MTSPPSWCAEWSTASTASTTRSRRTSRRAGPWPGYPGFDRITLRIGVLELDAAAVPAEVAIAEAVALVAELSTDDSPGFVNGVLAKIASS